MKIKAIAVAAVLLITAGLAVIGIGSGIAAVLGQGGPPSGAGYLPGATAGDGDVFYGY